MAEILGKNLDLYDDSIVAEKPFNLAESEIAGPRFMTGEDLARSTRISKDWKDPVAIPAQASIPYAKAVQPAVVGLRAAVDSVADMFPNLANTLAQTSMEVMGDGTETEKTFTDKLFASNELTTAIEPLIKVAGVGLWALDIDRKELMERAKTYDEAITLLENRDYPSHEFAKRVIANTTSDVETRRMVRELYRQAGNIDSSKWYNKAGEIIGAMAPVIYASKSSYGLSRSFGAGRLAATRIAQNIAKGYIGVEMAGQYAEETAAQYLERTGDKTFKDFTAQDATGITAMAYGAIGAQIEMMGGVEPIFAGALSKVGLKSGLLKAGAKIGVGEATEELLQGLTETLMRKIDGSSTKTWREGFLDSLNSAAWGLFIGGSLGTVAFHTGRSNLVKGIKQSLPNITNEQATQIANAMIENTAEVSSQDPTLRSNLREKVALMYRDIDIENKENIIDATTDLEYGLIAMDSAERGIDIAENPIFAGEVNELGWFRNAIPENRRAEITALNDEIKELKNQLAEENKKEEKNWEKIDELENKLAQVNQYVLDKLSDLARDDASAVRRILRSSENKFVNKEKERATKKAIKGGSVEVIKEKLSQAGFRTRDLSGTQVKKLATMNWELLQDQDLGVAQSRGAIQIPLTSIERNTISGDTLLLRAGYTQEQIDKMDDETWNRAVQIQFKKEMPPVAEVEYTEEDLPDIEFQEQFDLADENARLDDIYPAYEGETIEVDGKERTVYNSNGERIAQSEPALRNFYKWFGNSKVVDEQGRPLVVYHGSPNVFDAFDTRRPKDKKTWLDQYGQQLNFGSHFATAKKDVKFYGYGKNIYPVYLKIENPYFIEDGMQSVQKTREEGNKVMDDLISQGYDGVAYYPSHHWTDATGEYPIHHIDKDSLSYVAFEPNQIKSVDNRGTYSSDTGNIYWQNRVSGGAPSTYRGAYIPAYRFIQRANRMDASTLSHELAHDWMEVNFDRYRSGEATEDFMRAWGALEKALGIEENATQVPRKASETFARAYEAWIMTNEDWAKLINIDDKDKDAVEKLLKDYQGELRNIYNDMTSKYFKDTWGKLGELKPELKAWFDRAVNITDLDVLVERGEMTEEQATEERLNRAIDKVIETTTDEETTNTLRTARLLNDTARYEVEGGNKNSLQNRLALLAREIDENNMVLKKDRYNTRRDMMQVAEAADNFVKTRLDDALAIINGEMAEVEGLYKEDIYTALERLAIENGDMGLINELKNSEIANRLAKELGQRVAGFRNWKQSNDIDTFSALKSADNIYNKALENKKAKKQFNSALDLFDESLKNQDKKADTDLDSTLKDLECK